MKTIDEYMKLPYTVELIPDTDEGGFTASIPALPGCLSVGDTVEDAYRNIEDAKHEWLTAAVEEGISIPEPDFIESYSGQFKLRIPKTLHRQLALQSKREGVSMNQYCVYLLSQSSAVRA